MALIVSGPDEIAVVAIAKQLAARAPTDNGVEVLGPAPAVLAVLRGRHRHRLLLKTARDVLPQPIVAAWLERVRIPSSVQRRRDKQSMLGNALSAPAASSDRSRDTQPA